MRTVKEFLQHKGITKPANDEIIDITQQKANCAIKALLFMDKQHLIPNWRNLQFPRDFINTLVSNPRQVGNDFVYHAIFPSEQRGHLVNTTMVGRLEGKVSRGMGRRARMLCDNYREY